MVAVALKCPFCGNEDVRPYGTSNGKQRYGCNNPVCSHKTFYAEYTYNGCKPEVKQTIIKWAVGGAGVRATARELRVSTDTVIKELKKGAMLEYVNKGYFETHKSGTIRVEMDEMWSFYQDKTHQIWLWRAIGHETGEIAAYWFGTRGHKNPDTLLELPQPLKIGKVYSDGNYAYYERFTSAVLVVTKKDTQKIERKHLSLRAWSARLVRKGIRFSKRNRCARSLLVW